MVRLGLGQTRLAVNDEMMMEIGYEWRSGVCCNLFVIMGEYKLEANGTLGLMIKHSLLCRSINYSRYKDTCLRHY